MEDLFFSLSLFYGLIVIFALIMLCQTFASMRKSHSLINVRPKKIKSFQCDMELKEIMKVCIQFSYQYNLEIDFIDEENGILILSESASLKSNHWGFFYPIYINQSDTSGSASSVDVGIKSKLFQFGPIVSRKHEKIFTGIRAAIYSST